MVYLPISCYSVIFMASFSYDSIVLAKDLASQIWKSKIVTWLCSRNMLHSATQARVTGIGERKQGTKIINLSL
jgi:hypothetical protein